MPDAAGRTEFDVETSRSGDPLPHRRGDDRTCKVRTRRPDRGIDHGSVGSDGPWHSTRVDVPLGLVSARLVDLKPRECMRPGAARHNEMDSIALETAEPPGRRRCKPAQRSVLAELEEGDPFTPSCSGRAAIQDHRPPSDQTPPSRPDLIPDVPSRHTGGCERRTTQDAGLVGGSVLESEVIDGHCVRIVHRRLDDLGLWTTSTPRRWAGLGVRRSVRCSARHA